MMRLRQLPELLDSRRPDGGVNRLITNPGGRLFQTSGEKRIEEVDSGKNPRIFQGTNLTATGERPLLIQHQHEGHVDFNFRATIAAPRNGFWHSCDSLAGRPFKNPINIKDSEDVPEVLRSEGEWVMNADLQNNSLRTLAARISRDSVGYGLEYWWVDFDVSQNRPYVRRLPASSVRRVQAEPSGVRRFHVRMSRAEYEQPGDATDASKFSVEVPLILVFRDGDPQGRGESRWAWYEVYEAVDTDGKKFNTSPSPFTHEGEIVDRVSLEPHTKVPFVPFPTGELSSTHFVLPGLLEAAQLDYLALQVSSNHEYGTILANTFLRFAKGLTADDVELWSVLGPQYFYATTSPDADMKWVTLGGEALQAGMDLVQFLMRAIEVAGLAPMLTRSPGDERATGMAMAGARASSVAEAFYLQWQGAIVETLTLFALYVGGGNERIPATLSHDLQLDERTIAQASLLAKLYLDQTQKMPAVTFWSEMRSLGIVSEDVDLDALILASESPERAIERERVSIERAKLLVTLSGQGHFGTQQSVTELYKALKEHGVLVGDADSTDLAAQFELERARKRNMELYLDTRLTPSNFWKVENATIPVEIDPTFEVTATAEDFDGEADAEDVSIQRIETEGEDV